MLTRYLKNPSIPLLSLALAVLAFVFIIPWNSSLWLDETITAWITNCSWKLAAERALIFQGQSPLYFWFVKAFCSIFGNSEIGLRLVSITSSVFVLFLTYKIGLYLFQKEAGLFAALFLLSSDNFLKFTLSARPYSLALLFLLLCVLYSFKTTQKYSPYSLLLAILSFVAMCYCHPFFSLSFIIILFVFKLYLPKARLVKICSVFLIVSATLLMPLVGQVLGLWQRQETLYFANPVSGTAIIKSILPAFPCIAFLTVLVACFIFYKGSSFYHLRKPERKSILFLTIWIVSPPLLLILNSLGTNHSLFLSRLYFWNLPAIALLTGGVVSKIKPSKAQQAFFIIFAALVAYGHSLRPWHIEEWRSSAQILRQQSETLPVLLYSGLIENESVAWLENPSNAEYIKTPFMYYQIPQSIRVLPGYLDIPENTSYLKRLLCTELENQKQFLFIALQVRNPSLKTTFIHENILRLIEKLNISVKSLHQNDLISIWLLTRNNTCGVFDTLSANNFK